MTGTILIADAIAASRITLKAKLVGACYASCLARDVDDAVALARVTVPDAILASDRLPGGGIAGLRARLDADPSLRGTPLVAITTPEDRLEAIRSGADAVLERPLDEFMMLARLRRLLAGPRPGARGGAAAGSSAAAADEAPDEAPHRGMAEAAALWDMPRPPRDAAPARMVLVAPDAATGMTWKRMLEPRTGADAVLRSAEQALAAVAAGSGADIYLIAADLAHPGDGLRLLSELRARPASRRAAFAIALAPGQQALAPIALDLGAGDVLPLSLSDPRAAEEAALRLAAQLSAKHADDHRRNEAERERRWAMIDPLTGLANRRHAMPRLAEMAASGAGLAAMMLDLDRFKAINDGHGHAAGDAVLAEVARRLGEAMPAGALIARIGGEEFLVAAPAASRAGAETLAEALRAAIAARPVALGRRLGGGSVAVTASVGLAYAPAGAREAAEALTLAADAALLAAKAAGRNRVMAGRAGRAA